jgi:hypothetical protein
MAFFGTFACSAPAQRNERQNRPGYSVFFDYFFNFSHVDGINFFALANFFLQSSARFRDSSSFFTFRRIPRFVLFGQFWYFLNFSNFSKSCAHLLTFSEKDHFDDRFSTFFRLQEAEKSSIFRHFYGKTGLRPLRRRPRCGYEVEVTLCVRRNESQVRQS